MTSIRHLKCAPNRTNSAYKKDNNLVYIALLKKRKKCCNFYPSKVTPNGTHSASVYILHHMSDHTSAVPARHVLIQIAPFSKGRPARVAYVSYPHSETEIMATNQC